ncbi:MAG: hypothetical protein M5U05_18060 [Anaerolineales bacterium]|nr:hypothetical protein [Anaerolineales bacterium]
MSGFVRNLNRIKTLCNQDWLSPSQKAALDTLTQGILYPGTTNLWGPAGVGKTFLAWILQQETGAEYVPHISAVATSREMRGCTMIVDNCSPDRISHRNTLNQLRLANVSSAILVSRELIQDYTSHVELVCSEADLNHIRSVLVPLGIFTLREDISSLWYVVNPYFALD